MSILDKKKKIFGNIAAARTLTEGLPNLKLSSSFSSINTGGNSISFLSDLIKSLIGYEALVGSVVDILTHSLSDIEREVKIALKTELKDIVSCGVDPHLPSWIQSTGTGIIIEVNKIDFLDQFKVDPISTAGRLLYNDITSPLTNSSDFNTFLYGVIQDDGNTYTWNNIIDVTFNSLGTGNTPNNTITIKANSSYNTKTLTDLNNNFVDSLTLFKTENIVNQLIDTIYGSISSNIGKSLKQLENEAKINNIVDKMIDNDNKNPISDDAFTFTNEETYKNQLDAANRKKGNRVLNLSTNVSSSIPISNLTTFNDELTGATTTLQKKDVISNNLNKMANSSSLNLRNKANLKSVKLEFIQQIVNNLIKSIIGMIISPKVIAIFIVNYKIIYGPTASFDDGVDFIKKNKNLFHNIIKKVTEEIVKILLRIALKRISELVAASIAEKEIEKSKNKLTQLLSLVGIPQETLRIIKGLS